MNKKANYGKKNLNILKVQRNYEKSEVVAKAGEKFHKRHPERL